MTRTPLPTAPLVSVGFSPERLNRLDSAMQAEINAGHYAGISVMIARHGKLMTLSKRYIVERCRCYNAGWLPSACAARVGEAAGSSA